MKLSVYPRLAWTGICKNKRLYTPYLLTCVGMVMMYYIVSFLASSKMVRAVHGGENMQQLLGFGCGVIAVFAVIFLLYTNSFLIRRRKKEFGLYNILGMNKRNLAKVLLAESVMIGALSLAGGLLAGIALSKFAELCMINILRAEATFTLSIAVDSLLETLVLFAVIFALLLLKTLLQVRLSNPMALLHGENTGEKPPKANWVFALLGAALLIAAYYIAVSIESPMEALVWFFVAVIMVIVATYLLFISGSVAVCKLLQKNGAYYYKTNHFVSVSSMVYRMKRNGAGLASICVLCTIVLVMISSTVCLYASTEDSLIKRYPHSINLDVRMTNANAISESPALDTLRDMATSSASEAGLNISNVQEYRAATTSAIYDNGCFYTNSTHIAGMQADSYLADIFQVFVIPLSDYNRLTGESETLNMGEAIIYCTKIAFTDTVIQFEGMSPFTVKKVAPAFIGNGMDAIQTMPSLFIFLDDYQASLAQVSTLMGDWGSPAFSYRWYYAYDTDGSQEDEILLHGVIRSKINEQGFSEDSGVKMVGLEGRERERAGLYGLYGGLFFLGILLGLVFIFAAVLIMYYKQISEGYEDQSRFEIMQKVGMTKKDIRRSINSQVLTVFFLPLLSAGLHLLFASPMIYKMLALFNLTDRAMLTLVTICCFLVFAVFYVLIYRVTSRAYFGIVSGAREDAEA